MGSTSWSNLITLLGFDHRLPPDQLFCEDFPMPALSTSRVAPVLVAVGVLAAGMGATGHDRAEARAVEPCQVKVTKLNLASTAPIAAGGLIKRYRAGVNYPGGTAYDQKAKVVLGVYPAGVVPTLLSAKIGARLRTGDMVKAQEPGALAAINGDFFRTPIIKGIDGTGKRLNIARGPMVKNGRVIHADRTRQRVVGIDTLNRPVAGTMGIRGKIQSGSLKEVKIQGINWYRVQGGGVTVFTRDWKAGKATPRPAGTAEWVINARNRITEIRTSTLHAGRRGHPVEAGTRVLAFSASGETLASRGTVGTRVRVRIKQSTNTGVQVKNAIGRGLPLIEKGVAAPLGCSRYVSKSARPRTVVGWTQSGNWRSFTVPGKRFSGGLRTGGFGLAAVANIARKLGLYNAYELDGGGSTTLYTKSDGGKWSRRDLYGLDTSTGRYEREVVNGLAFVR